MKISSKTLHCTSGQTMQCCLFFVLHKCLPIYCLQQHVNVFFCCYICFQKDFIAILTLPLNKCKWISLFCLMWSLLFIVFARFQHCILSHITDKYLQIMIHLQGIFHNPIANLCTCMKINVVPFWPTIHKT